jgi:hypothetical protein
MCQAATYPQPSRAKPGATSQSCAKAGIDMTKIISLQSGSAYKPNKRLLT